MSTLFVHSLSKLAGPAAASAVASIAARGRGAAPKGLYATLATWQRRYALRRHLAELDDRLLEDAGLTREDARREAAKPFWRE